jgi:hypothetical protein
VQRWSTPGQSLNDFVALLIAVAAFLFAMLAGQALLHAIQSAWGSSDTILAFGPILRLAVSAGIGILAYRRLLHMDAA